MRLADFRRVEALVHVREHLMTLRDGATIQIVIGGHHQGSDFIGHVEQGIRLELRYRIHELDQQLIELGVSIDQS